MNQGYLDLSYARRIVKQLRARKQKPLGPLQARVFADVLERLIERVAAEDRLRSEVKTWLELVIHDPN